jgi:hypothetical protein
MADPKDFMMPSDGLDFFYIIAELFKDCCKLSIRTPLLCEDYSALFMQIDLSCGI